MNKRVFIQLGAGLSAGIALIILSAFLFEQPYTYQGSLIEPGVPAADFKLRIADHTTFSPREYLGKIVLLYFGYTFCPDVCPTTLYDLSRAKAALGSQAEDIVIAMITVDPDRDTLTVLNQYVTTFDPTFFGLSGDKESLESVWQDYGVYRAVNQAETSAGYLVDHTARVYVIDRKGLLRMTFPFGMSWEAMANDLGHLLSE